jgi:hypothetical protein
MTVHGQRQCELWVSWMRGGVVARTMSQLRISRLYLDAFICRTEIVMSEATNAADVLIVGGKTIVSEGGAQEVVAPRSSVSRCKRDELAVQRDRLVASYAQFFCQRGRSQRAEGGGAGA